jgi:hypothetical protein
LLVIDISRNKALEVTTNYTACALIVTFLLITIGLVVFIIYDVAVHHGENIGTTSLGAKVQEVSERDNYATLKLQKYSKTVQQQVVAKILTNKDIWESYGNSSDFESDYIIYNVFEITEDNTCDILFSSIQFSCCCFLDVIDKMLCNTDPPFKFSIDNYNVKKDTNTSKLLDVFQIVCNIVYNNGMEQNGIDESLKRHDLAKGFEKKKPLIYMGLTTGYVKYSEPAEIEGFLVGDGQNECTLKTSFFCLV